MKNINTVYSLLRRAKAKLKKELGEIELWKNLKNI
jgi:DNA-directed RNA polymerase specialized sigma24 family protein